MLQLLVAALVLVVAQLVQASLLVAEQQRAEACSVAIGRRGARRPAGVLAAAGLLE